MHLVKSVLLVALAAPTILLATGDSSSSSPKDELTLTASISNVPPKDQSASLALPTVLYSFPAVSADAQSSSTGPVAGKDKPTAVSSFGKDDKSSSSSGIPSKDQSSLPSKDQSVTSTSPSAPFDKDKTSTVTSTSKDDKTLTTSPSLTLPDKDKGLSSSQSSTNDKTVTSSPTNKDDKSTSAASSEPKDVKSRSTDSLAGKDEKTLTTASSTAKDDKAQFTPASIPSKDMTKDLSSSLSLTDDKSNIASNQDKATSATLPPKDDKSTESPATTSDQHKYLSSTLSSKDAEDKSTATSNIDKSASITLPAKDNKYKSSSISGKDKPTATPIEIVYSFTLPPPSTTTSASQSGVFSKPEVSRFESSNKDRLSPSTVSSLVLSNSSVSLLTEFPGYKIVPSPAEGVGSTSTGLYSNKTSPTIPVWTPELLGTAYGGGFITTPSVYVTKLPFLSGPKDEVPPGYGSSEATITAVPINGTLSSSGKDKSNMDKSSAGSSPVLNFSTFTFNVSSTKDDKGSLPSVGTASIGVSVYALNATFSKGDKDKLGVETASPNSKGQDSKPTVVTASIALPVPGLKDKPTSTVLSQSSSTFSSLSGVASVSGNGVFPLGSKDTAGVSTSSPTLSDIRGKDQSAAYAPGLFSTGVFTNANGKPETIIFSIASDNKNSIAGPETDKASLIKKPATGAPFPNSTLAVFGADSGAPTILTGSFSTLITTVGGKLETVIFSVPSESKNPNGASPASNLGSPGQVFSITGSTIVATPVVVLPGVLNSRGEVQITTLTPLLSGVIPAGIAGASKVEFGNFDSAATVVPKLSSMAASMIGTKEQKGNTAAATNAGGAPTSIASASALPQEIAATFMSTPTPASELGALSPTLTVTKLTSIASIADASTSLQVSASNVLSSIIIASAAGTTLGPAGASLQTSVSSILSSINSASAAAYSLAAAGPSLQDSAASISSSINEASVAGTPLGTGGSSLHASAFSILSSVDVASRAGATLGPAASSLQSSAAIILASISAASITGVPVAVPTEGSGAPVVAATVGSSLAAAGSTNKQTTLVEVVTAGATLGATNFPTVPAGQQGTAPGQPIGASNAATAIVNGSPSIASSESQSGAVTVPLVASSSLPGGTATSAAVSATASQASPIIGAGATLPATGGANGEQSTATDQTGGAASTPAAAASQSSDSALSSQQGHSPLPSARTSKSSDSAFSSQQDLFPLPSAGASQSSDSALNSQQGPLPIQSADTVPPLGGRPISTRSGQVIIPSLPASLGSLPSTGVLAIGPAAAFSDSPSLNASNGSISVLLNPTTVPDIQGSAVKVTVGLGVGVIGLLLSFFLL